MPNVEDKVVHGHHRYELRCDESAPLPQEMDAFVPFDLRHHPVMAILHGPAKMALTTVNLGQRDRPGIG